MSERWRCFVAAPIDDALRARLATAVDAWKVDAAGLRWTDPAGWHLTLAFLGATAPEDIERIASAVERAAAGAVPMRLATGGLGAFASPRRARVLWYGIADPDGRLADLAGRLALSLGLEPADPFRPHLTLARARGAPISVAELVARDDAPRGTIDIDRIDLMRSHLGHGAARYERLASVRLEVATHV